MAMSVDTNADDNAADIVDILDFMPTISLDSSPATSSSVMYN